MKRAIGITAALSVAAYFYWLAIHDSHHVAGPFYVMAIKESKDTALFRCPDGPDHGCAGDGLPDATVFEAGADDHYVVVGRHPGNDKSVLQYFYFARIPQESGGWGDHPEKIIGPLTPDQFAAASASLHLPGFRIVLDDLK